MRNGRRTVLAGLGLFLLGTFGLAAPPDPQRKGGGGPVRLTVEVTWTVAPALADGSALDLELTEGQVLEALTWPGGARVGQRCPDGNGWRLGVGRMGRVRVRVEAPTGASLLFRSGDQVVRVPILAVLEGPQRTPTSSPLEIGVERLPWDALTVGLGSGDGMVAPGATVPVAIGFNILTPEPTRVDVRCMAELRPIRGGEPTWQHEQHEVVATDQPMPPARDWNIPAPTAEGMYLLEVRSSWEPIADSEGTRLGRWLRRRRSPTMATSSVRRLTLAVVGPNPVPVAGAARGGPAQDVEVLDLARPRGYRPTASGRAPLPAPGGDAWAVPEAALVEATRRDRLRGWITRAGSEAADLARADAAGLAWSAIGLKVPHPDRPHRLTVTVTGGHPAALGVALVNSPGGPAGRPRIVLDVCASGPPILQDGPPASFSWLVWPDAADPTLVLVNRDADATVQLGTVTLTELAEVPAPPAIVPPGPESARGLGLVLSGPNPLDRFGGGASDPADLLAASHNLVQYLASCGASVAVLPEGLSDRPRRRALDGQAGEDAIGPDRLELLLRILGHYGCAAWLELAFDGPLPGLPAPDSAEALARGLVRVDRRGLPDGPAYHPLHPEVREAMRRRVADAVASRKGLAGLLIRLGPRPTLLGSPDTGLDDETFARFVSETFGPGVAQNVPGLNPNDPNRFAARAQFLAGSGRMPWLTWRSRGIAALYAELGATARRAAPGVTLAVATPGLDAGPAGLEARRVDLAGLDPNHAWRAVGLDLETWPVGESAPIVLRGVGLAADALAHDLATSPVLDAQVAARAERGLLLATPEERPQTVPVPLPDEDRDPGQRSPGDTGLRLTAVPTAVGMGDDELLGHAMAALDPRWVLLSASAIAGHEERVRHFARIFRSLPASHGPAPSRDRLPFGVAARTIADGGSTYLSLANDTPYPIRLEATLAVPGAAAVEDLGRGLRLSPTTVSGGKQLVLDMIPFGVSAIRINAPQARVGPVLPSPSGAVLAEMQAQYQELSSHLARLNRGPAGASCPANPGFEPASTPPVQLTGAQGPATPDGWLAIGGSGTTVEIDPAQPHAGRGSLRLSAPSPPGAAVSERFVPNVHAAMTVQAWFRSDQPDAKLRLWIEGEAAGRPFIRRSELTIQPEWAPLAVRAAEVPPGGLDGARLRFELLTAGSLWVDDLAISGEAPSEPERLNARRALMAALQAFREQRYGDFARLAASHWARHLVVTGEPTEGTADRAGMIRTGATSALPPGRRLR